MAWLVCDTIIICVIAIIIMIMGHLLLFMVAIKCQGISI